MNGKQDGHPEHLTASDGILFALCASRLDSSPALESGGQEMTIHHPADCPHRGRPPGKGSWLLAPARVRAKVSQWPDVLLCDRRISGAAPARY